jgi:hypothetical protein
VSGTENITACKCIRNVSAQQYCSSELQKTWIINFTKNMLFLINVNMDKHIRCTENEPEDRQHVKAKDAMKIKYKN